MIVLGLDTCLNACSAAVLDGDRVLARASQDMARGHQERLAPLVREVMADAGIGFEALDRVGVTIGPGSFTGLRVGLAFAKGLSAALSIPLIGVGTLEALAYGAPDGLAFAVIDARRGQVYLQGFRGGTALSPPEALAVEAAVARLAVREGAEDLIVIGSGGALLVDVVPLAQVMEAHGADPAAVARIAASREAAPVTPLYLRAPDARLPGGRLPEA
jgi:tRNA threonylcarbamoyladenosine biosynthesis protein TsaB